MEGEIDMVDRHRPLQAKAKYLGQSFAAQTDVVFLTHVRRPPSTLVAKADSGIHDALPLLENRPT